MQAPGTNELFRFPMLRPGVQIHDDREGVSLIYRNQSCDIEIDSVSREHVRALIESMKTGGASIDELRIQHENVSGTIDSLLKELDRLGLVTESTFEWPRDALSGPEFNTKIRDLAVRAMRHRCESRFFSLMEAGSLTRAMLIGYALEYYYLVREAPGLIAPALSLADSRRNRQTIQRFLVSELDHDLMLAESLAAVGVDVSGPMFEYLQPLPSTFALCASLGVFAKQHPLSFKSILFLFEVPSVRFNDALVTCCKGAGLPEAFWTPLLRHAHINDSLDHDDITAELLRDITAISREEQLVVEKNIVLAIETMAQQENEIVEYYGRSDVLIPRVFQ